MNLAIINKSGLLALVATLIATGASAQNLLVNGDFSSPNQTGESPYLAGSTDITGWTVDTTPADGVQLGESGIFASAAVGSTDQQLQLTGGSTYDGGGGIQQSIATTAGDSYLITLDAAVRSAGSVSGEFNFGGQDEAIDTSDTTLSPLSWTLTATGSSTLVDITGYADSASDQLVISDVSVTATPEPTTLALAALGGLVLLRRNRK